MIRVYLRLASGFGLAVAMALTVWACGGGSDGGGGNPGQPSPSPGGGTVPTITITPNGVDPKELNIHSGQAVRFVNSDTRAHEMFSTPHGTHTDCPSINEVGMVNPGASKNTGSLTVVRICGFHDHMQPDNQAFRGQINVDTTQGPAPGYIRP
jgi:plastocyanin